MSFPQELYLIWISRRKESHYPLAGKLRRLDEFLVAGQIGVSFQNHIQCPYYIHLEGMFERAVFTF